MQRSSLVLRSLLVLTFFCSTKIVSNINDYYPYQVIPSSSNYGDTGLIELPNARFLEEASMRLHFSSSYPHEYTTITASPFTWLEASYRYTEIKNLKYGPYAYSRNQTRKDKGFDLKIGLMSEGLYFPSVALGLRDLAGTGVLSSEYLVASKRINELDFSLGLGWGLLGSEGGVRNPFESLSESFAYRDNSSTAEGGNFSYNAWFSGKTSLFGGIEYNLRKYGLRFKLEYDTSNPDEYSEAAKVDNRFNIGVTYFLSKNLNLHSSFERGNQFRIGFSLTGNFLRDSIKKPKPKNVIRLSEDQLRRASNNKDIFYRSLNRSLRDESIYIQAATMKEEEVDVAIASPRFYSITRQAGRAARVVSALSPENISKINIHSMNGDFEVATISIDRKEFDEANNYSGSRVELLDKSELSSTSQVPIILDADFIPKVNFPEFRWNMSPSLKHQIGGPEGFYLGALTWKIDTSIKFRRNLILYTSFGINIYDTFNNLRNPSQSTIPHVRSDIQDYLTEGKNNIQRMQLEYFASPFKDIFVRADVGILEEMFAGFGGEILYRPFKKNIAYGMSIHNVTQRDYDQRFKLKDYNTTTGHFSIYNNLPRQINSHISIGKYLAGDKGVTLDLSRRFKTGFTLGVFATKTNLSAIEFGEGSFDKGFYFSIPTQLFYSDYRTGNISFGLHPLTKDGGAFLNQHNALIGILGDTSSYAIKRDWDYFLN
mgnify:CR=1 FL=1